MFEIGFSELVMVGLVSLLVIGPERLPKVARIAGFWIGRTQRMVTALKAEIKHELQIEEIRQAMKEQTGVEEFEQLFDEAGHVGRELKSAIERPLIAEPQTKTHE